MTARDGEALVFDYAEASVRLEMAQRRAIEKVSGFDWPGATALRSCPRPSRRVSFRSHLDELAGAATGTPTDPDHQ
jgi:hypothetical protein